MRRFLSLRGIQYVDNTASFQELDFTILATESAVFYLEVKEKRQTYNLKNWPDFALETDLFILDDLTVRKCLGYAPRAGILVRDNVRSLYFFFPVVDLALMPRLRVNRPIHRNAQDWKGKWLINLQNGKPANTLDAMFGQVQEYLKNLPTILFEIHSCYGNYVGEQVESGGIVRHPSHWDADVLNTR